MRLTQSRTLQGITKINDPNYETTLELDSHADTCVLGQHAYIFQDYNRPVHVEAYDPKLGSTEYQTVSGAVAYTDPSNGRTLLLLIHQAIYIPHLDHHLLCPMQCRVNDVTVNDTPKFLVPDPTDQTHALTLPDPVHPSQTITLPLELRGVISLLNVRTVTADQFNDQDTYPHVSLTSDTLTWDPSTTLYRDQELALTTLHGDTCTYASVRGPRNSIVVNSISSTHPDLIDITHDDIFHHALSSHVIVSTMDTGASLTGNVRARKAPGVDFMTLAKRWCISPHKAHRTVLKTTQRGVRKCLDPTLTRRFPTNDRMLRYRRLPRPCFTDTLVSGTPSKQGHRYAQVYCTSFGWTRVHPMKRKGEAHETLSLLFHRDGVPPVMILDGSKEQTLGEFRRKLRQADCHQRQTEPYSPWMNAAEGCIRELKRGSSRKMLKTGSPKTLWDHCIELEGLIRSCTVNDIYETNGETPETIMTGNTADISHICEFGWYDWVMFRDNAPSFPDNKMTK